MIVADASAVVEFLLGGSVGRQVEEHLLRADERVHVPALLDVEVAQVLRRMVRLGIIDESRGRASLEILQDMPITRHFLDPLLPRIWELRDNLTAYDAAYVALGEALQCPLLTLDDRIAGAPGLQVTMVVPGRT